MGRLDDTGRPGSPHAAVIPRRAGRRCPENHGRAFPAAPGCTARARRGRRPSGTGRWRKAPNAKDAGGGRLPPIRGRERSSRRGGWGAGKPGRGADPASRRPADCPAETPYASGRRHAGMPGRAKNAAEFVAFVRFADAAGSGRVPEPAPDCADNPNRIKRAAKSGRALIGGADPQRCARVPRRPGFVLELARSFILNRHNISMSGYGANVRLCGRNVAPELMTWP